MSLRVIEAVVRRMTGMLLKQPLRSGRPDVVVARREIERHVPPGGEVLFHLPPFSLRRDVVQALDGVSDSDHKRRIGTGGLAPYLFVDSGLRFPGSVTNNDEPKR